jgi:DNA-binding IclR family transcriptional regulator
MHPPSRLPQPSIISNVSGTAREKSRRSATITGYLGSSNDAFDTAMGKFVLAYADQAERDHAALKAAVRKGEIAAIKDA